MTTSNTAIINVPLNPIARWDAATLQSEIANSNQTERFYSIMATVSRIGVIVLSVTLVLSFGMMKPSYFPITITLMVLAYHPTMSITYHKFNEWVEAAKDGTKKYERILLELQREDAQIITIAAADRSEIWNRNTLFRRVISAQFQALETQKQPPDTTKLDELQAIYEGDWSDEALTNYCKEKDNLSLLKRKNLRLRIQQAFLFHVACKPTDQKTLLDYGRFQLVPIRDVVTLNDRPAPIFVISSTSKSITDHDMKDLESPELAQLLFN